MPDDRDAGRDAARAADHAGIDRLLDSIVPSLIAKLATLNVGELEVREGDWHVRLRRPPGAVTEHERRASDRAGARAHPGHDVVGAPASLRGVAGGTGAASAAPSLNGSGPVLTPVGPGHADESGPGTADGTPGATVPGASSAVSPAVGIFQPGSSAVGGARVRAGDRLGAVDMLGIPQDVIAPADGIVMSVLVEAGTAVEYGQELIHIEAATVAEGR